MSGLDDGEFEELKRYSDVFLHVEPLGLVAHPNLSQTQSSCTMTLNRVYADGNAAVVDASFYSDDRDSVFFYQPMLFVGLDRVCPPTQGGSFNRDGLEHLTFFFDTSGLGDTPEQLALRLTFDVSKVKPRNPHRPAGYTRIGTDFIYLPERNKRRRPEKGGQRKPDPRTFVGSFSFEVSCLFTPARRATIEQTVESNGTSITLERVSVSPLETKAYLHIHRRAGIISVWMPENTYLVGDDRPVPLRNGGDGGSRDGVISIFRLDRYDKLDEWTLVVKDLRRMGIWGTKEIKGEWEFNFTVPPPTHIQKVANG